jgi:hypothetical protein
MNPLLQSFSPISPLTRGTDLATGAIVAFQHAGLLQAPKL